MIYRDYEHNLFDKSIEKLYVFCETKMVLLNIISHLMLTTSAVAIVKKSCKNKLIKIL